jgi:Skp family chaperone for outer membrane proteins
MECPAGGTRGRLGKLENEENRTVKRIVGILAGMAILGIGVYLGSHGFGQQGAAQNPAATREPLKTRIAVLNITQVRKNYTKFKNAQEEIKRKFEEAQKNLQPLEQQITQKQNRIRVPDISAAERDQLERELKKLAADYQDKKEDALKGIRNREGEISVQIFQEIEDAVNLVATHNAIELVLTYNDFTKDDRANYYNPSTVMQKLMTPAIIPMYVDDRMDITKMVTKMLNDKLAMNTSPGTNR